MKLAEAFGLRGRKVDNAADFEAALREAIDSGRAAVIECTIDPDEMVRPMVGGGSHITQFMID